MTNCKTLFDCEIDYDRRTDLIRSHDFIFSNMGKGDTVIFIFYRHGSTHSVVSFCRFEMGRNIDIQYFFWKVDNKWDNLDANIFIFEKVVQIEAVRFQRNSGKVHLILDGLDSFEFFNTNNIPNKNKTPRRRECEALASTISFKVHILNSNLKPY